MTDITFSVDNLDPATVVNLATELTARAEDMPDCLGRTESLWDDCGSSDSGRVCPNCSRYATVKTIADAVGRAARSAGQARVPGRG